MDENDTVASGNWGYAYQLKEGKEKAITYKTEVNINNDSSSVVFAKQPLTLFC
jgi:hypothetical protein